MSLSLSRASRALSVGLLLIVAAEAGAQLTPPPGPVAPSMKRLDQIEPRKIVNSLPGSQGAIHVIDQPGSYVLSGDITGVAGKSGIVILCDGEVTLDLNGFSLIGVPGSLHGIDHKGGTGAPDTRRVFVQPHVLESRGTIRSWGGHGITVSNVDVCDIGGVTIMDCGGAACRVLSHDRAINSIGNIRALNCSSGVQVDVSSAGQSGGLSAGKVSFSDLSIMNCTGDAAHVRFSSSAACDVSISRSVFSGCSGHGACVEAVAGAAGGGLGAGKVSYSDLSVMRCTGDGVRCVCTPGWAGADCSVVRVAVGDVDGDGIHMSDAPVSFSEVSCVRCGGNGLHVEGSSSPVSRVVGTSFTFDTTIFACYVKNAGDVSLSDGRCSNCAQDGIHLEDVALGYIGTCDATSCGADGFSVVRAGKITCGYSIYSTQKGSRATACGGHGLSVVDCPDTSSSGLDVSLCLGDGVFHDWTSPPTTAVIVAHEAAHVVQNGGSGVHLRCPPGGVTLDASSRRCTMSSNSGSGLFIECPASSTVALDCDDTSCAFNGGNGIEVRAQTSSHITCACSHLRCVGNGGDGMSVVATDPAQTLVGGSLSLDSSVFSSNIGDGCRADCPVDALSSRLSSNGGYGIEIRCASPFDSGGTLTDCTLHQNALHGARCGPGRYSDVRCDVADNGGDGLHCESGCLIVDQCLCNRNGGDGVSVHGTLTVSGGAMRRNGSGGIRCWDGTCSLHDCICELNGANPGVTGGGMLFDSCPSVTLQRCISSNNTGPGVRFSSSSGTAGRYTADSSICTANSLEGMSLSHCVGGQVLDCQVSGNGAWGIECLTSFTGGQVSSCTCTGNGGGILIEGTGNLITSNSCTFGAIGGLSVLQPQGNMVGRLIDSQAALNASCDPRANVLH